MKSTSDTLRVIREENLPNLQPFDDDGLYRVEKALLWIPRLTTILDGRRGRGTERFWTQTEQD